MGVFRISFGVALAPVVLLAIVSQLGNNNDWNDQLSVLNLSSFDLCWRLVSMGQFLCLLLTLLPVVLPMAPMRRG